MVIFQNSTVERIVSRGPHRNFVHFNKCNTMIVVRIFRERLYCCLLSINIGVSSIETDG